MSGIRKYGPGKFRGPVDELLYRITLRGWSDDEIGSVHELGWYGLIRGGIEEIDPEDEAGLGPFTKEERKYLSESAGFIVSEDNYGFVEVEAFDSEEDLERAWQEILDSYEEFYREGYGEDDAGDGDY